MTIQIAILSLIILFTAELMYFQIASRFNIIDQPNHRSSHTSITIRGGGIIFPIAVILWWVFNDFANSYFVLALIALSVISFIDDLVDLNRLVRLSVHLTAVLLLFFEWSLYSLAFYWLFIAAIFVIATINAYNFMDGINGILGAYSLVVLASLFYINNSIQFTDSNLILIAFMAVLVFNFFNFRKKAKCFAGDIGSVSIAFMLVFMIGQLIIKTENFSYVLLLLIYGMDTSFTVLFRAIRKENITEAHRSHFYQYLANNLKWGHLTVSSLYAFVQLLVNILVIYTISQGIYQVIALVIFSAVAFFVIRYIVEGKERLFVKYN